MMLNAFTVNVSFSLRLIKYVWSISSICNWIDQFMTFKQKQYNGKVIMTF